MVHNFAKLCKLYTKIPKLENIRTQLYTTLQNLTQLYSTSQKLHTSLQYYTTPSKFYTKEHHKPIHKFYIIVQSYLKTQLNKICLHSFNKTAHNFTQLYTTIHNSTQVYTIIQKQLLYNFTTRKQKGSRHFFATSQTSKLDTTLQNFTILYTTKLYTTLHNLHTLRTTVYNFNKTFTNNKTNNISTTLHKTLHNSTHFYTTQPQLFKTLQKLYTFFFTTHIYIYFCKAYNTSRDFTKLYKT